MFSGGFRSFWRRWSAAPAEHARFSAAWWLDKAVVFTVFGVTGSTAMWVVRPLLYRHVMGIEGEPTPAQRGLSLLYMLPAYYAILLTLGTLAGKHHYFRQMATRPFHAVQRLWRPRNAAAKKT